MIKRIFFISSLLIYFIPVSSVLLAGPTLIQDNRVTNLGTTPVLGRGYSIATNTYQSTCLKDIITTEPSYDFTYNYKDLNEFISESSSEDNYISRLANSAYRNYLQKKEQELAVKKGEETTTRTNEREIKSIMVNIQLDSYYASVDESKSKISDSASKLIENNDLPGFFSSCGSYYIRSIRRNALFISIFEFESINEKEDKEFVYQLETELKSFRKEVVGSDKEMTEEPAGEAATETSSEQTTGETGDQKQHTDTFSRLAQTRNLSITAAAFGLGKNEKATLISYDIDSFKAAVKDAFLAMQNPETGKVTSIEVVPWVENTEFQSLMKLDEAADGYRPVVENGKTVLKSGYKLLMYEKKYNLNLNAEFLAEVERANRSMMNIYYKAKICKKHIETNWKQISGGNKVFKPQYVDRYVMNNSQSNAGVKLTDLDAVLTDEKINGLLTDHREFMYGGGRWGKGASLCISSLLKYGIFRLSYRDIEECAKLEENLSQVEDEMVENHCMPVLFDKGIVPRDTTGPGTGSGPAR